MPRLACTCLCLAIVGCRAEPTKPRFVPTEQTARHALETALTSWKRGDPPGKVGRCDGCEVMLVDNSRKPEQTLERFTVLGEAPGEGPRCLAARLVLKNPSEEVRQRFVVFGEDPLWVYRYEDFEMMIHWQCTEPTPSAKTTAPVKKKNE